MIEYAILKNEIIEVVVWESEKDSPLLFKFDISPSGEIKVENLQTHDISIDYAESMAEVIEIIMVVLRDEECLPATDLEHSLREHIPNDYPADLGEGLDYKDLPSFSP